MSVRTVVGPAAAIVAIALAAGCGASPAGAVRLVPAGSQSAPRSAPTELTARTGSFDTDGVRWAATDPQPTVRVLQVTWAENGCVDGVVRTYTLVESATSVAIELRHSRPTRPPGTTCTADVMARTAVIPLSAVLGARTVLRPVAAS